MALTADAVRRFFSTRDPGAGRIGGRAPRKSVPDDIIVRIPAAYDVVLTRGYGDYMRVPDPQDKETHEPFHIVP